MQTLKLYTEDAGDGFIDFVVEGSPDAFAWLISAAGNARDGFDRNQADVTTGEPRRLVLRPEVPNAPRDQAPKKRTAHLQVDHQAAKASAHIPVTSGEYAAISSELHAELFRRGVRFAVKQDDPVGELAAPAAAPPPAPPEQFGPGGIVPGEPAPAQPGHPAEQGVKAPDDVPKP